MRVAIVGAGNVGSALERSLGRAGHTIVIARRGAVAEAVRDAEAVILAVPYKAAEDALRCVPLAGKVLIDATNPIGVTLPDGKSGAEVIAALAPGARVVKCFNQTGAENMAGAGFTAGKPVMFAAGDDAAARTVALQLAADAGFEAVDAGPLQNARALEALARLWIHMAFQGGAGRSFAFGILRR